METIALHNIYYNVIISWFIYYLFACFQTSLPWAGRNMNAAEKYFNDTFLGFDSRVNNWHNLGDLRWEMVLCLLAAWSLFCLLFFIDRIGKIRAYIFLIAPYIALFILMIFGATLEGANSGIKFYVTPKWTSFAGTFHVSPFCISFSPYTYNT